MKLRLPLLLAAMLLGATHAPIANSAPVINYFMSASQSGSKFVSSPSGSNYWTIDTTNNAGIGGSNAHKFEGYLTLGTAATFFKGVKIGDLRDISFTIKQADGTPKNNNLYVNIYTNLGTGADQNPTGSGTKYGSKLTLETIYANSLDSYSVGDWYNWSTTAHDGKTQLTVCDTSKGQPLGWNGAPTLGQVTAGTVTMYEKERDYREETIKWVTFNSNDAGNNTPASLDLSRMNITVKGQEYQWNFVSADYVWKVNDTQILGGNFHIGLVITKGEKNSDAPLLLMEGNDANITINGGFATGENSLVSFDTIQRAAGSTLSINGAKVQSVHNDLGRDSGILTFDCNIQTPLVSLTNSTFTRNQVTADGHQSRYGNLLGTNFSFWGIFDEDTKTFSTKLQLSHITVTGNTATTSYSSEGGPQGTFYISSGDAELDHVTFTGNILDSTNSGSLGGALCTWATMLKVTDSSFTGNIARGLEYSEGGALYYGDGRWGGSSDVSAAITRTLFTDNKAKASSPNGYAQGGAIKLKSRNKSVNNTDPVFCKAALTLTDSTFTGNTVSGNGAETKGGAIYNINSDITITATTDLAYQGNAVLMNGTASDAQGGFLYLHTDIAQAHASFDISENAKLTIGTYGKTGYDSIAGNAGSLISKTGKGTLLVNSSLDHYAGAVEVNGGTMDILTGLSSAESVKISGGASLYIGHTSLSNGTLTTRSGLGQATTVTAESTAKIGTHIYNETDGAWVITYDDLASSTAKAFSPYLGEGFTGYTYLLKGNVTLTNAAIKPGDSINAGEGSTVDLGTTLPESSVVISGGTVDASKVEGPLTDEHISGASGNLVTCESQTLVFTQSKESGFSVNGGTASDGSILCGASIVIAKSPEASEESAPVVVLTGNYASRDVKVQEGALELKGSSAVLGVAGGALSVGQGDSAARFVNNGTVLSDVTVSTGSQLKGAGTFLGDVTLAQGASLYVGNSPGRLDYEGGTLSVTGNELSFCLNGYQAATKSQYGAGTYSNIHLTGGSLQWSGDNTLVLDLGAGLLASDTSAVSFRLLSTDGTTAVTGLAESLDQITLSQTGALAGLLNDGATLSWENNSLILSGMLNTTLAEAIIAPDAARLADGLWSSTRSVSNFAHVATSQLDAPRSGNANYWVSGLGDFARVSGNAQSSGFDYNGGGYAAGADFSPCKCLTAGLAFGQTFGTHKSGDGFGSIKQDGIMMAVYGRNTTELTPSSKLNLDGYFSYGQVDNKSDALLSQAIGNSHAKWNDDVYAAGLKASWSIKLDRASQLTPFIGLDYVHGAQDRITQTWGSGSRNYNGGNMQTWSLPVGVNYKVSYALGGEQYLVPEVTVAYSGDIARKNPSLKTDILGKTVKYDGNNPGRNAFTASTGLRWIMNKNWSTGVWYNLETRRDMTNQGVNASVNCSF